jgi:hypothetical protein
MNRPLKIIGRIFLRIATVFFGIVVLYVLFALLFSAIPVNKNFQEDKTSGIDIYIQSNGVHTDLVLPIRNRYKDWSDVIPVDHTISNDSPRRVVDSTR